MEREELQDRLIHLDNQISDIRDRLEDRHDKIILLDQKSGDEKEHIRTLESAIEELTEIEVH